MKHYCPYCNCEQEYYIDKRIFKNYKGVEVNVKEDVPICKKCGNELVINSIEDENLKIVTKKKNVYYDHETYTVDITNKTDYPIVLGDGTGEDEIAISVNEQLREETNINAVNVVLQPNESRTFTFVFEKYCDDGYAPQAMYFTDVRVLKSYSGTEETRQQELDNAVRRYSLILNFNVKD